MCSAESVCVYIWCCPTGIIIDLTYKYFMPTDLLYFLSLFIFLWYEYKSNLLFIICCLYRLYFT